MAAINREKTPWGVRLTLRPLSQHPIQIRADVKPRQVKTWVTGISGVALTKRDTRTFIQGMQLLADQADEVALELRNSSDS